MNGDNQMNQFPIADKPSRGPMLGIVIIVLLIILGGIYILSSRARAPGPDSTSPNPDTTNNDNQFTTPPAPPSQSNDINALEQEANGLESDLQILDQEAAQ